MKILVLHNEPKDFKSWLESSCPLDDFIWASSPDELSLQLKNSQPEVVFSIKHSEFFGKFHAQALAYPSVRWFQVGGSGTEHLATWDSNRVTVTNSVGVLAPFHAERAMAALLSLSTGLGRLRTQQELRVWRPTRFPTLQGKNLLILGYGQTGLELAKRAKSFGMRVLGVRRSRFSHQHCDESYHLGELTELWERADVLSVNLRHTAETNEIVDESVLRQLPSRCILLNAARGKIVDQKALVTSLNNGQLGGAWLDVTSPEPLPTDSPLWTMPNVIITPHCADQTQDFPLRFAHFFRKNLERYRRGEKLSNVVSSPSR